MCVLYFDYIMYKLRHIIHTFKGRGVIHARILCSDSLILCDLIDLRSLRDWYKIPITCRLRVGQALHTAPINSSFGLK